MIDANYRINPPITFIQFNISEQNYIVQMEKTKKQKEEILKDLWYKRKPSHDYDQNGVDRFWGAVICVFEDYQKALTMPIVVKRYRVEAIAINKNHLFDKEIDGLENASEVFQDLKIKYLNTYTSVKMTEI